MAAVLLTGHGGPEKLAYRINVKVPVPAPGEVLAKVSACGMNNTDVWVRQKRAKAQAGGPWIVTVSAT